MVCKVTKEKSASAEADLCRVSHRVNPLTFISKPYEWLDLLLHKDKALDPLSHRLLISFLIFLFVIEASLL